MIFIKSLNKITFQDIEEFCKQGVQEGINLDYKQDFPKNLPKVVSAFANTFGGIILIGVEEDQQNKPKLPLRGVDFEQGLSEKVTNILVNNIYPPVLPEIKVFDFDQEKKAIILIRIQQSNLTPHLINSKTEVYTRVADVSKPEQLADYDKIEWLRERREKSQQLRENILGEADERLHRMYASKLFPPNEGSVGTGHPRGQFIFSAIPIFPEKQLVDVIEAESFFIDYSKNICPEDYYRAQIFLDFGTSPKITNQSVINYATINESNMFYEMNAFGLFLYQEVDAMTGNIEGQNCSFFYMNPFLAHLDLYLQTLDNIYEEIGVYGYIIVEIELRNIFQMHLKLNGRGSIDSHVEKNSVSHERVVKISETINREDLSANRFELLMRFVEKVGYVFNYKNFKARALNYYKSNGKWNDK